MGKHKEEKKEDENQDEEPIRHEPETMAQKITYLEEELVRKDKIIEDLKKENLILFKTALKNSEKKVDEAKNKEK